MLNCYNCFASVSVPDQARNVAVMTALMDVLADTDFGEAVSDSSVDNVNARPGPDQKDADENVVYCTDCTMTMISDGLQVGARASV